MKLRYRLVNSLDVPQQYKDAVVESEKKLEYNAMVFIVAEIFKGLVKNIPAEVVEFASGYPFLLHQYACGDILGKEDVLKALDERKKELFYNNPELLSALNLIRRDSKYWNINTKHILLEQEFTQDDFSNMPLAFKKFEDFYLKHRSYGLITILIMKEYADKDLAVKLENANKAILNGMAYFYDAFPHEATFKASFSLLYARYSLQKYDIELLEYKNDMDEVQKYLIASGVFEEMIEIASKYFQEAIDIGKSCIDSTRSGGRISLLQHQKDRCDDLLNTCYGMFTND